MPRRDPRPQPPRRPRPRPGPGPAGRPGASPTEAAAEPASDDPLLRLGERLRRVALGLTAALVVARAGWPGEYHDEAQSGLGLGWALALLAAAFVAILGAFCSRRVRFRVSWADLAVYGLFALVALSARQGDEARAAINLAWEWAGVGLAYALLRHLPRTAAESSALAASLAATAVALAAFGLYQVAYVHPETRRVYRQDPEAALRSAGVANDPVSRAAFENRLLGSKEPTATFGLANSLAGYLVGPAALMLALVALAAADRRREGGRWAAILLAAPPLLLVLACLLLTKSRSAYLGLLAALLVPAGRLRRRVPARVVAGVGLGLVAAVALLAVAGLATGQLDRQVLTEAPKSLSYRSEYWVGTWRVIREGPTRWWFGLGPGNFAGPYLRHKLPQSSESISDPHNLLLEVWATAGLPALLALLAALGLAARDLFGRPREVEAPGPPRAAPRPAPDEVDAAAPPPARVGWLIASAGPGGWVLAMALRPELSPFASSANPFDGDWMRWVVLGGAWAWAALMGLPLWAGATPPSWALGAGALAVVVNLLAAGGIGFAPVALALWTLVALGLNLRADRPCGRLRAVDGWLGSFGLAAAWAATAGTFAGTAGPHWAASRRIDRAEAALAQARRAYGTSLRALPASLAGPARAAAAFQRARPFYALAERAYADAARADRYASRPWIGRAMLEYEAWLAEGEPVAPDRIVWHRINSALKGAAAPPERNPDNLQAQALRARLADAILHKSGWPEFEHRAIEADLLDALRRCVRLHPTDARLHARLSDALAEAGLAPEAASQARQALRLDAIIPHREKKLPDDARRRLTSRAAYARPAS